MPRVSVGLAVYNGEKYVREAIESVLAQTFKEFELIICDNASTDQTEKICREYVAKDPRVRYYRNEKNLGAAKNFKRVFELSSGEYFKWLAADNTIKPEFLCRCVEFLDKDPTVILACTKVIGRSEFENTTELCDHDLDYSSPVAHERVCKLFRLNFSGKFPLWGLMRSSVLKQTHLIRPFIGCDDCLCIELALKGRWELVPEYLVMTRRHAESYTDLKYQNDEVEGTREAQYIDPENTGSFFLPHWRRLWEYFLLVIRSKEKPGSKFIMVACLLYPVGVRWLKILIKEIFFAFGLRSYYGYMKKAKTRIQKVRVKL